MSNTPPASVLRVSLTDAERAELGAKYLGRALEALEETGGVGALAFLSHH